MSLAGPAPDGFYQAVFHSTEIDLDGIHIETTARARRAGFEIIGDITLVHHRLGYNGLAELASEVLIATAQVVPLSKLEAVAS